MNREERRTERKSRRRRLKWLETMRKRSKTLDKAVTVLEENFDEDEIENAKAFLVDYITDSGPFARCGDEMDPAEMDQIGRGYGLEPVDSMFILDTLEETLYTEEEKEADS